MGNAYEKVHTGADWYDIFKLQEDLASAYGLSVQITFEAEGGHARPRLLCYVTIVGGRHTELSGSGAGVAVPFKLGSLQNLPREVHSALSDVYDVLSLAAASEEI